MKIYDVIKSAEEVYVEEIRKGPAYPGMCWCLKIAAIKSIDFRKGHLTYSTLVANIPEFNPKFLKASRQVRTAGFEFWWHQEDTQSRLNAFHLLRSIYKQSDKEFIY